MAFEHEKRQAAHLLGLLEDGRRDADDIRMFYEDADPALIALILGWLRAKYHPGHSAAEGVLGRIVTLMQSSSTVARKAKEGAKDPIVQWFEESYDYRDLDRDAFLDEVIEKLEG